MTYSLKADWSGYRTAAVIDVLAAHPRLTRQLRLYVDAERPSGEYSTIKLDWSTTELDAAVRILEDWLGTSDRLCLEARDGDGGYPALVQRQAQVHAALRDIHAYRAATAEAVRLSRHTTGKEAGGS
jgi:hypothetical protein